MKRLTGNETAEELRKMAKKRCLSILERMDRTEYQLMDTLNRDGFSEEIAAEAVDYVKIYHYVDDRRFAFNYLEWNKDRKSVRQMKTELEQKGVSREVILECLEEVENCEEEVLRNLVRKKAGGKNLSDVKERQKIFRHFCRKGFGYDSIQKVIRDFVEKE